MTYDPQADTPRLGRRQRNLKRQNASLVNVIVVGITLVILIWGGPEIYSGIDESGWIPHTKVVRVYTKSGTWIVGESRLCVSSAKEPRARTEDVSEINCGDVNEGHDLQVKFWGVPDNERARTWSCQRIDSKTDLLTCKLQ
jgi:hypothetical protein